MSSVVTIGVGTRSCAGCQKTQSAGGGGQSGGGCQPSGGYQSGGHSGQPGAGRQTIFFGLTRT